MCEMLQNAVERGTGTAALLSDRPVAGKTGTTDDHRDGWFVGFTPQYTSAVWVGNDNFSRMWHVFGGDVAAPLFRQIMQFAHKGLPVMQFGQLRGGQVSVLMCSESKKRANAKCPTTYKEYFKPGMVPTAFCPLHGRGQALPLANPGPKASKSPDKKEETSEVPVEVEPQTELPVEAPTAVPLEVPTEEPILDLPPVDGSETGPTYPETSAPLDIQEGDLPPAATPEPLPTSALP
jgi:membrane peptidoglycan carboxypeptidase